MIQRLRTNEAATFSARTAARRLWKTQSRVQLGSWQHVTLAWRKKRPLFTVWKQLNARVKPIVSKVQTNLKTVINKYFLSQTTIGSAAEPVRRMRHVGNGNVGDQYAIVDKSVRHFSIRRWNRFSVPREPRTAPTQTLRNAPTTRLTFAHTAHTWLLNRFSQARQSLPRPEKGQGIGASHSTSFFRRTHRSHVTIVQESSVPAADRRVLASFSRRIRTLARREQARPKRTGLIRDFEWSKIRTVHKRESQSTLPQTSSTRTKRVLDPSIELVFRTPRTSVGESDGTESIHRLSARGANSRQSAEPKQLGNSVPRTEARTGKQEIQDLDPALCDRLTRDVIRRIEQRMRVERERLGL